jgi:hypothetical protein
MIRCTDVHKSYRMGERTVAALRGVDLKIGEPGFYAIMGQVGEREVDAAASAGGAGPAGPRRDRDRGDGDSHDG